MKLIVPEGISAGDRFGILAVLSFAGRNKRHQAIFTVECACGSHTNVLGTALKTGKTTRCNAGHHRAIHGMTGTPEYSAWKAMNWRVKSSHPEIAKYYRDKGISVCAEWRDSFQVFLGHIGMMPNSGMTVDRIDGNGNYEPGNVRWATRVQQMRNTRANHFLSIGGRTQTMSAWCEESGLPLPTVAYRVRRGWPEGELLSPEKWRRHGGRPCA